MPAGSTSVAAIVRMGIGPGLDLRDAAGDIIAATAGRGSATVGTAGMVGPVIVGMSLGAGMGFATALAVITDLCDTIMAGSGFIDGSHNIARSTGGVRTCKADLAGSTVLVDLHNVYSAPGA